MPSHISASLFKICLFPCLFYAFLPFYSKLQDSTFSKWPPYGQKGLLIKQIFLFPGNVPVLVLRAHVSCALLSYMNPWYICGDQHQRFVRLNYNCYISILIVFVCYGIDVNQSFLWK